MLALWAALTLSALSSATDAGWNEATRATGSYTALTLVAPTIVSCTAAGTLSKTLVAVWSFPPGSGYTAPTNINLYYSSNGVIANLLPIGAGGATTTGSGEGPYTTTYNLGVLGIASTTAAIGFETTVNGWTSPRVTRVANWPLTGPRTCA
ncbi:hypothetical protein J7E25_07990 [Agromyces sp. ISL-38]|uniref:hypothetical protein n=1 Tax=Agromyces sp. ISL-38 TaxID=2819107 RepID=UPI001BE87583|nr:hypothetical protein [Agromyces sp. ISL-38]MBT2499036.1 hypothetical protein [Agromyces sp. ISL-38]